MLSCAAVDASPSSRLATGDLNDSCSATADRFSLSRQSTVDSRQDFHLISHFFASQSANQVHNHSPAPAAPAALAPIIGKRENDDGHGVFDSRSRAPTTTVNSRGKGKRPKFTSFFVGHVVFLLLFCFLFFVFFRYQMCEMAQQISAC